MVDEACLLSNAYSLQTPDLHPLTRFFTRSTNTFIKLIRLHGYAGRFESSFDANVISTFSYVVAHFLPLVISQNRAI